MTIVLSIVLLAAGSYQDLPNESYQDLIDYLLSNIGDYAGGVGVLYPNVIIGLGDDEKAWSRNKLVEEVHKLMSETKGFETLSIHIETVAEVIELNQHMIQVAEERITKLKNKHESLPDLYYNFGHEDLVDLSYKQQGWYVPKTSFKKDGIAYLKKLIEKHFCVNNNHWLCIYSAGVYQNKAVIEVGLSVESGSLSAKELNRELSQFIPTLSGFSDVIVRLQSLDRAIANEKKSIEYYQKKIKNIREKNP
jgi:hypothetical protein